MSLKTRLTLFFLGMLALVLLGFALTLYHLARAYLYRQADERLEAALDTLSAAAEIKPDKVEWEPQDRHLLLGQDVNLEGIRWTVLAYKDAKQAVFRSPNLEGGKLIPDAEGATEGSDGTPFLVHREGEPWRLVQRRLVPSPKMSPAPTGKKHKKSTERPSKGKGKQQGRQEEEEEEHDYAGLLVTAGLSMQPLQTTLRNLALLLTGLSASLWLLAAFLGHWLCRRGLMPVTRMAERARAMNATALEQRLPSPRTRDELEELSNAFNDLLTRLQESFERQQRFTGDASHQLRTPLTAMLGQIEIALRRERPPQEYRQALSVVQGQAIHLRRLVEMLLFLARANSETQLPDLEPLDLGAWLTEHLQTWSEHERRTDLQINGLNQVPVWALAHEPLLGQLFDNLLDNACKYSEPGTPITFHVRGEREVVCLEIRDRGCGIPEEDLPHVFEPFYRSAQARRLGRVGVGLGLAVAQRIASALGSKIQIKSQGGLGTQVIVKLQGTENSQP